MSGQAATKIGPYTLERPIGEGGGGIVYLARRGAEGQRVALKTVHVVAPERVDVLRREIRAISRVRHPDAVEVYDDGVHEGRPWFSMAYLEAPTLFRYIADLWSATEQARSDAAAQAWSATVRVGEVSESRLRVYPATVRDPERVAPSRPPPAPTVAAARSSAAAGHLVEALSIVAALCRPLAFLHGEGIVHRDLKPSNIFVPSSRQVIVADFGLATDFEGADGRGTVGIDSRVCGTVAYMAPEQIQLQNVDARTDLYSVGCILYELLTGQPPFGRGIYDVLNAHVHVQPLAPSSLVDGIPPELDEIVLRLLAKDPAQRIGYAEVLERHLLRLGALPSDRGGAPRPRPYLYRSAFINRVKESRQLTHLLESASAGVRQQLVLVVGESGIGKSRLVAELGAEAQRCGIPVVASESRSAMTVRGQGEARSRASDTPLGALRPFLQLVAEQCHRSGSAYTRSVLGQRGQLLNSIEPAFQYLPGLEDLDPLPTLPAALAQRRVFSFLAELLRVFSERSGMVLVLDDLQWADELTLSFLEYLATPEAPTMRLLVVATCRKEEQVPSVDRLASRASVIAMGRLGAEEVHALVRDVLTTDEAADELAQLLAEQSEGNPYFVGEYLRTAVACRMLELGEEGAWRLSTAKDGAGVSTIGQLPLPTVLRELLGLRLRDLQDQARAFLAAAAVLGRSFDPEVCRRVAELSEAEALEAERELMARQIVCRMPKGKLRFDHEKIREIQYTELPEELRRQLHEAAATTLEAAHSAPRSLGTRVETKAYEYAELGHHWSSAGFPERAADYLREAAEAARVVPAMREAARYYRRALEQLARSREVLAERARSGIASTKELAGMSAREAAIQESLGDVLERDGQHEAARDAYAAAGLRRDDTPPTDRARLLRKQALTWEVVHDHAAAISALDQAVAALEGEQEPTSTDWESEWLEIHVRRAVIYYFQGEIERMNEVIAPIEAIVQRCGDAKQRAMLFHLSSNAKNRGNRFIASDEVVDLARKAVRAIDDSDDVLERANLRFDLGFALLWRGLIDEARATLEYALELARATGDVLLICRCLVYLGVAQRRQGDHNALGPVVHEVLRVATAGGFNDYIACARAHAGWLDLRRGDLETARDHLRAAVTRWRDLAKSYPYPFQWLALLPYLEISLLDDDLSELRVLAAELLDAKQLQLPAPLEEALARILSTPEGQTTELRVQVAAALETARQSGYL